MRIQILELPKVVLGEAVETPFAVIFDEVPALSEDAQRRLMDGLREFKEHAGARVVAAFPDTVEVVRA